MFSQHFVVFSSLPALLLLRQSALQKIFTSLHEISRTGSDGGQTEAVAAHASAGDKQLEIIHCSWSQISHHSFTGPAGHRNPGAVPVVSYSEAVINATRGHLYKQDHRVRVHCIRDGILDHLWL